MPPDLTVSVLSMKGTRHGEPCRFPLIDRARAAFGQGIASIGATLDDDITPEVRDYVNVDEIEWVNMDEPVTAARLRQVTAAIAKTGANRINVGVCSMNTTPLDVVVAHTARLADEIAPVAVAFEPVAFGWLRHLDTVLDVVNRVNRPNVGLLLDMWQVGQDEDWTPGDYIPVRQIAEVQVCGVAEPLTYATPEDDFIASQDRPRVQDSQVDPAEWLAELRHQGYGGPVSFETPRKANYTRSLDVIAAEVASDMNWVLQRAASFPWLPRRDVA